MAIDGQPDTARRSGSLAGLIRRARETLPAPSVIIFGSAIWGVVMALASMTGVWLQNGLAVVNPFAIAAVYFYGGSLAFAPGLWFSSMLFGDRSPPVRLVGGTLVMALAVHFATAATFALQYRVFYSHWHAGFLSLIWFFQLAFTSLGAVYIFTAGGLVFYWPLSVLAFLAFGLWFAFRGAASLH